MGYQLGSLIAMWAGYGMSFHKTPNQVAWRVSNLIQIPIGLAAVVVSFWYPESPVIHLRFLVRWKSANTLAEMAPREAS
jgi:hypothetical protein